MPFQKTSTPQSASNLQQRQFLSAQVAQWKLKFGTQLVRSDSAPSPQPIIEKPSVPWSSTTSQKSKPSWTSKNGSKRWRNTLSLKLWLCSSATSWTSVNSSLKKGKWRESLLRISLTSTDSCLWKLRQSWTTMCATASKHLSRRFIRCRIRRRLTVRGGRRNNGRRARRWCTRMRTFRAGQLIVIVRRPVASAVELSKHKIEIVFLLLKRKHKPDKVWLSLD